LRRICDSRDDGEPLVYDMAEIVPMPVMLELVSEAPWMRGRGKVVYILPRVRHGESPEADRGHGQVSLRDAPGA
jgi:hypothetical protein